MGLASKYRSGLLASGLARDTGHVRFQSAVGFTGVLFSRADGTGD